METSITISMLIIFSVLVYYIMPLIVHRIKTRKVRVVFIDKFGEENISVLYLYPDDPLWEIVKAHKDGKNV